MTDISKEAVDALLQGVTGKKWKIRKTGMDDDEVEIAPVSINGKTKPEVGMFGEIATVPIWTKDGKANARFIAAARELVPALRAALDEAEARAVKAEAERDAANALLRDGLLSVQTWRNEPIVNWAETVAAHLGAKP